MKPFYDKDGITIFNADCREVLPTLGVFDLLLTDPPYGIGEDGGRFRDRKGGGHRVLPRCGWDKERPKKEVFEIMLPLGKDQIIWGGNYFSDYLPVSKGWMYWDKLMGGDFADGELCWTSLNRALRKFTYCNKEHGKVHPTQKPLALMRWCLSLVPDAETILDPFMGSGTTLVAAKMEGRKAVGIEINEKYCEAAVNRLAQGVLF